MRNFFSADNNAFSIFEKVLQSLNLYTVPRLLWIVEYAYLCLNAVFHIPKAECWYTENMPEIIADYNDKILELLSQYCLTATKFSLFMMSAGFLTGLLAASPFGEDCFIRKHTKDLFYLAVWLFAICLTYRLYAYSCFLYCLLPIFLLFVEAYIKMSYEDCTYMEAVGNLIRERLQ